MKYSDPPYRFEVRINGESKIGFQLPLSLTSPNPSKFVIPIYVSESKQITTREIEVNEETTFTMVSQRMLLQKSLVDGAQISMYLNNI